MIIRTLNEKGVHKFRDFVNDLRSGIELNIPTYLLDSEEYSVPTKLDIQVDAESSFESRYEMGVYLVDLFKDSNMQSYMGDSGFWSWFALVWFEQLCPNKNGKFNPSKSYHYILSKKYNHRPRHSVFMTWQLVERYGKAVKFMLAKSPSVRGELTEQILGRQELYSSESVMKLASTLYSDPQAGFKRGSAGRKSGSIIRYISWIQQLQMTVDVFSITLPDLEDLLPKEFDRFRGA